jgi:ATP-dependent Clp protease ATP-binding subunit ClpB
MEEILQIVDIQMRRVQQRLKERQIELVWTDAARRHLAQVGFDPAYGARPLKRAIQREVLDPLALKVLEGEFREGATVTVDAQDGRIVFH